MYTHATTKICALSCVWNYGVFIFLRKGSASKSIEKYKSFKLQTMYALEGLFRVRVYVRKKGVEQNMTDHTERKDTNMIIDV